METQQKRFKVLLDCVHEVHPLTFEDVVNKIFHGNPGEFFSTLVREHKQIHDIIEPAGVQKAKKMAKHWIQTQPANQQKFLLDFFGINTSKGI